MSPLDQCASLGMRRLDAALPLALRLPFLVALAEPTRTSPHNRSAAAGPE